MPCNDCSRAEACPPCVNEPDSACLDTRDGKHCPEHDPCCYCGKPNAESWGSMPPQEPEPRGKDCPRRHPGSGLQCLKDGALFHMEHVNGDVVWDDRDDEPPMTPEEEEQAPSDEWRCANESGCYRQHTNDCEHGCRWAADELAREANEMNPPPPQPVRRPPYAVAYSADGHLYEVLVPGDAIVSAVDGALVIKHAAFMVHGIVRVMPVPKEGQ